MTDESDLFAVRQAGLREWTGDERPPSTTGIEVAHMTYAALGIELPHIEIARGAWLDYETAIDAATWRTTEYAIREAALNGPPRPEGEPPEVDPLAQYRTDDDDPTEQATLPEVEDDARSPQFAHCSVCDGPRLFKPHPTGWHCSDCRTCVSSLQTALTE